MTEYNELVERAAAARRCSWSIPEEDHPRGKLCRREGHCLDAARAMLDAAGVPQLLASRDDLASKIAAIEHLCTQADIETHEATQAWLVGNIGAVLAAADTSSPLCPECVQGKHGNCVEQTLNDNDDWVPCGCPNGDHE